MMLLGRIEELKKSKIECVEAGEHSLVLIYCQDQFFALDNLCPHKAAALCDGDIVGEEIECPWHKARFNIKTGRGLSPLAGKGVKSWPLTIEDGQLFVKLD